MKKIRILYTIPNFDTAGSGKAMLNIAMRLDRNIFEPHIACLNDKGIFFEKVRNSGIPVHIISLYSPARPIGKLFLESWKLSRLIKSIDPDIVHSFNYSADYSEALSVRMAGKKWIFTKKNMSWGGGSANAWKLRSFLANKIIIQNTDMQSFYQGSKKIRMIPRGVNTNEFYKRTPANDFIEKMSIKPGTKIILTVANLVPGKGIEVLIKAFDQLIRDKNDEEIVLLIVGDKENGYGQTLIEQVKNLGLADKIIFTGKQSNISDFHTIADVFVLPTLHKGEGSPVALLEAMASGTICIASNVPGIRDQLISLPDLMFTAGESEELKKKLSMIFDLNDTQKQELRMKIINIVRENYTIENEVAKHEKFYLDCLDKRVPQ